MYKCLIAILISISSAQGADVKLFEEMGTFYFPSLDGIKITKLESERTSDGSGFTISRYEGDGHDIAVKLVNYSGVKKEEFEKIRSGATDLKIEDIDLQDTAILEYDVDKQHHRTGTAGTLICRNANATVLTHAFYAEIKVTDFLPNENATGTDVILNRVIKSLNDGLSVK
jgi:hypothetical protein